ncbi:MAG: ROK family protein, partial [Mollicutes bacterium]|nr:ROK family protein [Mollicutes bacterium]
MKKAIGIDIGGAHVKIGIVDEDGNLEEKTWIACNGKTREEIRKESVHRIETYKQKDKDILGIGRGCPGSIDSQHGIVLYSNNLKRKNIPRKDFLEKTTGLKTRITNDANAAVLGEWRFGKARGRKNVVLLTLGTGLGSGIIVNGKLREGKDGTGAEIGHRVLYKNGRLCTCGRRGCNERYVSATGLILNAKEAITKYDSPLLSSYDSITIKDIFLSKDKDRACLEAVDSFVSDLKEVLINVNVVFRPEAILLGGGLSDFSSYFLPELNQRILE